MAPNENERYLNIFCNKYIQIEYIDFIGSEVLDRISNWIEPDQYPKLFVIKYPYGLSRRVSQYSGAPITSWGL